MSEHVVIERPEQRHSGDATVGVGIKTVVFHVHQDAALERRLQVALSVARACQAHLHLLHVIPIEAYSIVDAYGVFVSGQIVDALQKEADELRAKIEADLANEDVSWDYEQVTGELMSHLVQCAALADLVIIGRDRVDPEFGGSTITLFGDLLHQIRTPLLIIGDEADRFDPLGPAVIAWNGSYEVANAMRGALGLLKLSSNVRLLTVDEDAEQAFPSTRALEYLSRHGIHAELVVRTRSASSFGDELVSYALGSQAVLIIMGGYSHSRAGEYLFGGTTRDLLTRCPISLVMSR